MVRVSNAGRGKNFLLPKMSRLAVGSTQLLIQWVAKFFAGVEGPQNEVKHPPPSRVLVKNDTRCTSTLLTPSWLYLVYLHVHRNCVSPFTTRKIGPYLRIHPAPWIMPAYLP